MGNLSLVFSPRNPGGIHHTLFDVDLPNKRLSQVDPLMKDSKLNREMCG